MLESKTVHIGVDSPADIVTFIQQHGDLHITMEAVAYYRKPDGPGIAVLGYEAGHLIGVSACKINNGEMRYAITVTHREHRAQGIGSALLRQKITVAAVPYSTIVASDNPASIRMCEKAGLRKAGTQTRQRAVGQYVALEFREDRPTQDQA
jgi:GNAT superfamily N-acetyltransferase